MPSSPAIPPGPLGSPTFPDSSAGRGGGVSDRRAAAVSFGVSLAVHAAVAVAALLAVWTVTLPPREVKPEITVSFFDPAPSGVILTEPAQGAPATVPAPTIIPEAKTQAPTLSEQVAAMAPGSAPDPGAAPRAPRASEANRELIEARSFPQVTYHGLGAGNAQSIVYVVDAGGSMVTAFPRVKDELKRSLFKLTRTQRFQVVFFCKGDAEAAPLPEEVGSAGKPRRLIRATPEAVRGVSAWIDAFRPSGSGNPIKGLEKALAWRPDAVFVLSSVIPGQGDWKPDKAAVLAFLDQMNPKDAGGRRPVSIKTIQFFDPDPQGILQSIGEVHGGADGYTFVKRSDLGP